MVKQRAKEGVKGRVANDFLFIMARKLMAKAQTVNGVDIVSDVELFPKRALTDMFDNESLEKMTSPFYVLDFRESEKSGKIGIEEIDTPSDLAKFLREYVMF